MCSRKPVLRNSAAETLTDTGIGRRPASCHARACRQASWMTHRPMGLMRPESSAIGTKRFGSIHPRSGWRHRKPAREAFVVARADDNNRDGGSGRKQAVQSVYSATIGELEIE